MKSAGMHLLNYQPFRHTQPFLFLDKSTGPILTVRAPTSFVISLVHYICMVSILVFYCIIFLTVASRTRKMFFTSIRTVTSHIITHIISPTLSTRVITVTTVVVRRTHNNKLYMEYSQSYEIVEVNVVIKKTSKTFYQKQLFLSVFYYNIHHWMKNTVSAKLKHC